MKEFALITGSSKGIGKAIAEKLAEKGYSLLLVARNETALQQVAAEIKGKYAVDVHILPIDLSVKGAAGKVFDWTVNGSYRVSVLVNNAGYGLSGNFEKYKVEDYANMLQLNIHALVELTQLFLPVLKENKKSYIMNIASSAAYQAVPGLSVYAATKSFVLSFSRGLRYELRDTPVSVIAVSPGSTDTDFAHRAQVGSKGLKMADKVNMTPAAVAGIAVRAMFAGKTEIVVGVINKLGAFFAWLLPKKIVEKSVSGIYGV